MERLTTFSRKARIFQKKFSIHYIRLTMVMVILAKIYSTEYSIVQTGFYLARKFCGGGTAGLMGRLGGPRGVGAGGGCAPSPASVSSRTEFKQGGSNVK
jgi:hypothetical protein